MIEEACGPAISAPLQTAHLLLQTDPLMHHIADDTGLYRGFKCTTGKYQRRFGQ